MTRTDAVKASMPIQFITSQDESGCDCYFVVRTTPSKLARIKAAKGKSVDIEEYGEILASGFGLTPSDEVREEIRDKYGILLPSE